MRSEEFIDAIEGCGWVPQSDAQYIRIHKLWTQLFPTIASLEKDYNDLMDDLLKATERPRALFSKDIRENTEICSPFVLAYHRGEITVYSKNQTVTGYINLSLKVGWQFEANFGNMLGSKDKTMLQQVCNDLNSGKLTLVHIEE